MADPGGYVTVDPSTDPIPLGRDGTPIGIFRLNDGAYEPMPFLRCLGIDAEHEGGEPTRATFRYQFRDASDNDPDSLAGFEEVYPLDATGPAVVRVDDRLVVVELDPDGTPVVVFDGFAQVPDLRLDAETQQVQVTALGAEVRAYDAPLAGSTWRDADDPEAGEDVETDLDLVFNPTKDGVVLSTMLRLRSIWTGPTSAAYPVFLDPTVPFADPETGLVYDDATNPYRGVWTISGAIRYLLGTANGDADYVDNPDFASLDKLFQVKVPKAGEDATSVDPTNPATYDLQDLTVPPDFNLEGRRWPEAIRLLIDPFGFGLCFRLDQDEEGLPKHQLELYDKSSAADEVLVDLYLQPVGSSLDPAQSNIAQASLNRDASGLANEIRVTTQVEVFEASVVLAPGFKISASDAVMPLSNTFKLGDPGHKNAALLAYRRFIFDEAGEGHWDLKTKAWIDSTATDLSMILDPTDRGDDAERVFVQRRRPGVGQLYSKDDLGDRLSAQLWISTDYKGPSPGVWDRTGTWQQVKGSWELLDDCLGIRFTLDDPGNLNINKPSSTSGAMPFPLGKVNLIQSLANPDAKTNPLLYFRLTCGVPGDKDLGIVAKRRNTSVTKFTIQQRDDAGDRFAKWTISVSSHLNTTNTTRVIRDDTPLAQAYADARRLAHELGPTAGPVTIPRLTRVYRVGNKVRQIVGRDVSLAQNVGAGQGEEPIYPSVVRIQRVYDPHQQTILGLSDRRGEPRRVNGRS